MPGEEATPISIGRGRRPEPAGEITPGGDVAEPLGRSVAGMLRHLVAVLDREDRLESGTGDWLASFLSDPGAVSGAVRHAVLRALHLASDAVNFRILEELARSEGVTRGALAARLGLTELSVGERVGDLVSAGLAVKVAEANQVAGTAAGVALTEWVHRAEAAGVHTLEEEAR